MPIWYWDPTAALSTFLIIIALTLLITLPIFFIVTRFREWHQHQHLPAPVERSGYKPFGIKWNDEIEDSTLAQLSAQEINQLHVLAKAKPTKPKSTSAL